MTSISDPSLGGTLPVPLPITTKTTAPIPPTSSHSATSLDLINNKISSLISEYHTLSNEIFDHSKKLSDLKAKTSLADQPKVKEAEEAIVTIARRLTEVNKDLDAEFKKLDETYTQVVEQEKAGAKTKKDKPDVSGKTEKAKEESPIALADVIASTSRWSHEISHLLGKMTSNAITTADQADSDLKALLSDIQVIQLQKTFKERIKPLQKKSQAYLLEKGEFLGKTAKKVGTALQAGIAGMRADPYLSKAASKQEVFIAPGVAVYKQTNRRAREEEDIIQCLTNFYPGAGVMSSMSVRRTMPKRYGSRMIHGLEDELRSVSLTSLDVRQEAKARLLKHLSPEDAAVINKWLREGSSEASDIKFKPLMGDEQIAQYEQLNKYNWSYEISSGVAITLSLPQVLLVYFEKGMAEMEKISLIPKEGETTPPPTKEALIEILKLHGPNFLLIRSEHPIAPTSKEDLSAYTLHPTVKKRIVSHLGELDALALEMYSLKNPVKPGEPTPEIRIVPIMEGAQKFAYEKCELHKWLYELGPDEFVELNFSEVQDIYFRDDGVTILDKLRRMDVPPTPGVIGPAPLPPTLDEVRTALGIIEYTDRQVKAATVLCEASEWANAKGEIIDYKKFKELYSTKHGFNLGLALEDYSPMEPNVTEEVIRRALNFQAKISFELVLPELVKTDSTAIRDVQAKPFAAMFLMNEIFINPDRQKIFKSIGEKLTTDAQVQMMLTAEFQFLDLHGGNIGIEPVPNEHYERFKGEKQFRENLLKHLAGKLPDTTLITYTAENGTEQTKLLRDFPEYQEALNVQFKFVLFDTDYSLTESNQLQQQKRKQTGEIIEHLVPVRIALFESSLKDVPFSTESLRIMAETEAKEEELLAWIHGEDLLPFKRLDALDAAIERERAIKERGPPRKKIITKKEEVLAVITPYIEKFTLAKGRAIEPSATIQDLRDSFAKGLSKIEEKTPAKIVKMWKTLEEAMSVTIKKAQTLKKFAEQHQIDPEHLQMLNSRLSETEVLPIGTVIRTTNLTSRTPHAEANRIKIAKKLFPRLTKPQETALVERRRNRKTYLTEHENFSKKISNFESQDARSIDVDDIKKVVTEYISASYSPISETRKEELSKELGALGDDLDDVLKFARDIQKECAPTLFNISKPMYPLLAESYGLSETLHPDNPGGYIGYYNEPLEMQIATIRGKVAAAKKNLEAMKKATPPAKADDLLAAEAKKKKAEVAEKIATRLENSIKAPTIPPGYLGDFR